MVRKSATLLLVVALIPAILLSSCVREQTPEEKKKKEEEKHKIDHLIIEEVFYIGTFLEEMKSGKIKTVQSYTDRVNDTYIKVYNPTDATIYLDGYGLATSVLSPVASLGITKEEEDTKDKVLGSSAVIQFPGSGQEYPLKAGESALIVAHAINHTAGGQDLFMEEELKLPPKPLDLSKATFQWGTKEDWEEYYSFKEVTEAPQTITLYGSFKLSGTQMLALVDLKEANRAETIKKEENVWKFRASATSGKHTHTSNYEATKVPNEWIVDAVAICPPQSFAWKVAHESLDKGCAGVLTQDKAKTALVESDFSKSIRRKHNGKSFEESNNSTFDFEVVECSLLK